MKKNNKDIKKLTIEEIFDLEYKLYKGLSKSKKKSKQKEKIYHYKKILININNIKEEYDFSNIDSKLRYLKKEYKFLTKLNKIKLKDINFLNKKIFNRKTSKKFSIKNTPLPKFNKHSSKNDVIKYYEKNIETLLKNKMIYDGKLYYLENLYNNSIKKC